MQYQNWRKTMKAPKMMKKAEGGFTLIELMIVVAIIGILAAVALPAYSKYSDKAKYVEVVSATTAAKTAVDICEQDLGTNVGCDGGTNGIPSDIATGTSNSKYVDTVTTKDGKITVTPKVIGNFKAADTYILEGKISNGAVTWTSSGGGVTNGYAK
jgi:type IV pilus assembly protein PilA